MLIQELFINPAQFVIAIAALLIALSVHEAAHAFVADYLGDETPRRMGRLTLNPLAHLDPMGTILLLIAGFGWGKPVIINERNFKNPVADNIKVSLAGPFSNFLTACFFALLARFFFFGEPWQSLFLLITMLNLVLMVFNLIPVPPLDGSHLISVFLSPQKQLQWQRIGSFFLIAIFLLSFLGLPILTNFISFFAGGIYHFLTGHNFGFF